VKQKQNIFNINIILSERKREKEKEKSDLEGKKGNKKEVLLVAK
jgi:hypothetical protein